jgi:hypothetical protein
MARRITFEAACTSCVGGLWQGRVGYTCHTCGGTAKVTVALKANTSAKLMREKGWEKGRGFQSWSFQVVTAKGTVSRQKYEAAAVLTHELRRFDVGQTLGGWYEIEQQALAAGTNAAVYGVMDTGELLMTADGYGYSATGAKAMSKSGAEVIKAVKVTEAGAVAAIRELCEREGIALSEHAELGG